MSASPPPVCAACGQPEANWKHNVGYGPDAERHAFVPSSPTESATTPTFADALSKYPPEKQAELRATLREQARRLPEDVATANLLRVLSARAGAKFICERHDCPTFVGADEYPGDTGPLCPLCNPVELTRYLEWLAVDEQKASRDRHATE